MLASTRQVRCRSRADSHERSAFKEGSRKNSSASSRTSSSVSASTNRFWSADNAALHSEQTANIEMLARLRLDGFVRRNHQQQNVNSRCAASMLLMKRSCRAHPQNRSASRFLKEGEA